MAVYINGVDQGEGNAGEGYQTILPYDYESIGQGTAARTIDATARYGVHIYNNSSADGDNWLFHTYLATGTYSIKLIATRNTGNGIVKIAIDGTDVTSDDTYGAYIVNNEWTTTGIVVAAGGVKEIRIKVDGKNGASASYYMYPRAMIFWRTG